MKMMAVFFIILASYVFALPITHATTFEPKDIENLPAEAEQIFIGTVSSMASHRTGHREIVTDFQFVDIELIKGTLTEGSPRIRMLGGTVGEETLSISGAPTFRLGVRYLVFIKDNGKVMFPTIGGPQGIFEVKADPSGGEPTIHHYGGRALTTLPGSVTTKSNAASSPKVNEAAARAMTKSAFVSEIQRRLAVE